MGILSFLPIIGKFVDKGLDVIDKLIPDKDLATKIKAEVRKSIMDDNHDEFMAALKGQVSIIIAEASGGWLQRNWRPLIMAMFGTIIFNNYIFAPYIGMFMGEEYKMMLEIPPDMWSLLKLGISGYVVGRSVEKIAAGDGLKSVAGKIMNGGA